MSGKLKLSLRVGGAVQKINLEDVDMEWQVSKLRQLVATSTNLQPEDFEFTFCGRKLKDKATLSSAGVRPGVTIHILKRTIVEKVRIRDEAEIQELINSFGNIRNACARAAAAKLGSPATLEKLLNAVPALRDDPVAIALIRDPESFLHVLDFNKAKKVFTEHPALADACPHIISILFENAPAASEASSYQVIQDQIFSSLEALSDEEDMDDASQESDAAQAGDDIASIARFLLSERQTNNAGESSSTGSSIITPQMLGQAINNAFASAESGQRRPVQDTPSSDRESSSQLRQMLAQMHELGLRDDVINMQALQACDMNVQEAINLVLSGAMFD